MPLWGGELEFSIDVMSVLSKAGCNAGTCHGNLNGKGGFRLSLRGQDPSFDYHSIVGSSRGRRISLSSPPQSLILQKAVGEAGHRGGVRFNKDSDQYKVFLRWLHRGAKPPSDRAIKLKRLEVQPLDSVVVAPQEHLKVNVIAHFSDGSTRDVTDRACYELSNLNATEIGRAHV